MLVHLPVCRMVCPLVQCQQHLGWSAHRNVSPFLKQVPGDCVDLLTSGALTCNSTLLVGARPDIIAQTMPACKHVADPAVAPPHSQVGAAVVLTPGTTSFRCGPRCASQVRTQVLPLVHRHNPMTHSATPDYHQVCQLADATPWPSFPATLSPLQLPAVTCNTLENPLLCMNSAAVACL
jgi:hypothetical protein